MPTSTLPRIAARPLDIDALRVAAPCQESWDDMRAIDGERVRACDRCRMNVYNVSEMSAADARALIASHEGERCIRLLRRADGTVVTADCPAGLAGRRRRRIVAIAAAFFAALLCGMGLDDGRGGDPLSRLLGLTHSVEMGGFPMPDEINR